MKLAYIKDTLEHCPFDNLKGSAVGWLKDRILATNAPTEEDSASGSVFASSDLLDNVGEWLWGDRVGVPMYSPQISNEKAEEDFSNLQKILSFYLAVLNLLYLLLSNKSIFTNLNVREIIGGVKSDFLEPLSQAAKGYEGALKSGTINGKDEQEIRDAQVVEMQLLMMNCQQVIDVIDAGGLAT